MASQSKPFFPTNPQRRTLRELNFFASDYVSSLSPRMLPFVVFDAIMKDVVGDDIRSDANRSTTNCEYTLFVAGTSLHIIRHIDPHVVELWRKTFFSAL